MQASAAKTSRAWIASATVAIADASAAPVAGALVTIDWSNAKSGSSGRMTCTTSSAGTCKAGVELSTKLDSATLTVAAVARDGGTYAAEANVNAGPLTVKRPR